MSDGLGSAVTIRFPSTAAFYVNSVDRIEGTSSGDFTIYKQGNLFTGFFNRMALQEIVLDYGIPNVSATSFNSRFNLTYQIPPAAPVVTSIDLANGFYSVEQCLVEIVAALNALPGVAAGTFVLTPLAGGGVTLGIDQAIAPGGVFELNADDNGGGQNDALNDQLFNFNLLDIGFNQSYTIVAPRLLPFEYIDIVCNQLTLNQKLKDNDTSTAPRDVLYRWYFAWDTEPTYYDAYGFPILQGYRPFIQRRIIPFPKQIRWSSKQPVGSLKFQVYDNGDTIVNADSYPLSTGGAEMEFQMTLLLSED